MIFKKRTAHPNKIPMLKNLGVLIFPDFELLDVFGPLEMFGNLPDKLKIILVAEKKGLIKSKQGVSVMADFSFKKTPALDILLIPGGLGTRLAINNQILLTWLQQQAAKTNLILSVCTGSALLAKAGILDGRQATSNKLAFDWVKNQGPNVNWIRHARWVDDGNIVTSSGVAAGIDMSLHVIERLYDKSVSHEVACRAEYIWNTDAMHDPFS